MTNNIRNKKILITAGPTREWMDPVRFLSNPSSGRMGVALADILRRRGARVYLIIGPTSVSSPSGVTTTRVESARDMLSAVKSNMKGSAAIVATAAVSDWRFETIHSAKQKKTKRTTMNVRLVKNPDVVGEVGKLKAPWGPILIGFALETDNERTNALRKMHEKNLDLVIANGPKSFAGDSIRPTWIERTGRTKKLPPMTKKELSERIANWLETELNKIPSKR